MTEATSMPPATLCQLTIEPHKIFVSEFHEACFVCVCIGVSVCVCFFVVVFFVSVFFVFRVPVYHFYTYVLCPRRRLSIRTGAPGSLVVFVSSLTATK